VDFALFNPAANQNCTGSSRDAGQNKALSGANPSVATSNALALTALGAGGAPYVWQAHYDGNATYPAFTEDCNVEEVTAVDAQIYINPGNATNIVGNAHTLTVTLLTFDDASASSCSDVLTSAGKCAVNGANVVLSLRNNKAQAFFVGGVNTCTTDANGNCSVQINSTHVGGVDIRATATNFSQLGVNGTFTRATGGANNPDAHKIYINPNTSMEVIDHLNGLPNDATGSVTYHVYNSSSCLGGAIVATSVKSIVTAGVIPASDPYLVTAGSAYFDATYSGNYGTFNTSCTAEVVTVS